MSPSHRPLHRLYARYRGRLTRRIEGVPGPVHCDDPMLPWSRHRLAEGLWQRCVAALPRGEGDPRDSEASSDPVVASYLEAGASAIEVLDRGLAHAGRRFDDVASCLDLGCGYGRVVRWLVQQIEPGRITACDLHPVAVAFCAHAFDVRPLVAAIDPASTAFERYDLVWAGSVLTHLDATAGLALARRIVDSLVSGGVFVLSLHGAYSLDMLHEFYDREYADEAEEIRGEVAEHGVSYRCYERSGYYHGADYGMTWHDAEWLSARLGALDEVEILAHEARGWHGHHDVLVVRRRPGDGSDV